MQKSSGSGGRLAEVQALMHRLFGLNLVSHSAKVIKRREMDTLLTFSYDQRESVCVGCRVCAQV